MFRLNLVLLILFITSLASAQQTLFAPFSAQSYSIDHFTGEVYCLEWVSGVVLKIDPVKKEITETDLPSVPIFANKSHIGVVYDFEHRDEYLYDFETKSKTLLIDSAMVERTDAWPFVGAFSPDDRILAIGDNEYNFVTGKLYEPSDMKYRNKEVWSSDSSLVIFATDRNIYQYYPASKKVDTLVVFSDNYKAITDISYNSRLKKLFYCTRDFPFNLFLHMFDIETRKDSVLYDMIKEEGKPVSKQFISMSWSPDEKMLGFISYYATQSDGDLYVFHSDSSKVFRLTDISNNAGRKYLLQWLDNKTFIFQNATDAHLLYSFTLPSDITYVKAKKEAPGSYSLSNYPNPFNPSTVINYQIPNAGNVTLKVYDMLGKEVTTLVNEYKLQGKYSVQFNAKDLPSGMYIYEIRAGNFTKSGKMLLLK